MNTESSLEGPDIKESVECTNLQQLDLSKSLKGETNLTEEASPKFVDKEKKAQTCSEIHPIESLKQEQPSMQVIPGKAFESEVQNTQLSVTQSPSVLKSSKSESVSTMEDRIDDIYEVHFT